MSDQDARVGHEALQFDRLVTDSDRPGTPAVACTACRAAIHTEYYDINGHSFCRGCRDAVEASAETPRGLGPLIMAGAFGFGAGLVGAAIYYAVIAIANLEIGIVAVLIGYMVGYAVRKGAGGRGGRRFQVLAVMLTYASVALAYTPIAVKQITTQDQDAQKAQTPAPSGDSRPAPAPTSSDAATTESGGSVLMAVAALLAFVAALPVLVVVASFPSGLISAFIIFIGMRQAWKMTGAPRLEILGPFRVAAVQASTPA